MPVLGCTPARLLSSRMVGNTAAAASCAWSAAPDTGRAIEDSSLGM